ncbi:MAG TPA: hypothetical protein PKY77_07005 [Phycisphaerae bacterium]|nr:hypothetical protein [Phycisphaerae bacterium]HRY69581.1 hypothetical protein [Phycisphaerae bacterium]HSA29732.1 hypothetical protein [Phycisphaerae bacterium]
MGVRLLIWANAFTLTMWLFNRLGFWPTSGPIGADLHLVGTWTERIVRFVVFYNIIYVAELVVLRLLVPTPKEGRYRMVPGGKIDRQLVWSSMLALLTKARYEPPFPGFLVYHISSLPPMCWLMGPIFGPRSRSCSLTDNLVMDPHFVTIGRNVVLGMNAVILGHHQERDWVVFKRTVIEDDVVVGGDSVVFGGCVLKQGCMIGSHAVVLPETVVGPNEFWAGVPARKIRDLPPVGQLARS